MSSEEHVVLVDSNGLDLLDSNGQIRTMPKLAAHRKPTLHRAISVFVFSSRDELLLQKRAASKYHSADLWSNTCCSHPKPGEKPGQAAERRLWEEMRIRCRLTELMTFTYQTGFANGLHEFEYDHVFAGFSDERPEPDPAEVADWKWVKVPELEPALNANPEAYSFWLRCCYTCVIEQLQRLRTTGKDLFVPHHLSL
jgi:isopentenyl-diphosphate delta-isomerase